MLAVAALRPACWRTASAVPGFCAPTARARTYMTSARPGSSSVEAVHLDRAKLAEDVELVALRIVPRQCSAFMTRLSKHVLRNPRVKSIIPAADDSGAKLMLLSEGIGLELAELPSELREFVRAEGAQPLRHTLRLRYEDQTVEQALRKVLPAGMEVPHAFEQVGHVAHINLRDEHLPYKALIGAVVLDKNTRVRTVVNKVHSISNEFRVFPMEVIAGETSLRTSVRENGATFQLDYGEVYWNSRLETEHKRILDLLPPGGVLADAFATSTHCHPSAHSSPLIAHPRSAAARWRARRRLRRHRALRRARGDARLRRVRQRSQPEVV